MALSAFEDKSKQPNADELAQVLGKSHSLWNELQRAVCSLFSPALVEWGYASKSTGWGMRIKTEKRVIVYMTPCRGYFRASFALGEKAVQAAHNDKLPAKILAAIDAAPKYAEGRGVRIEVRTKADVKAIAKLAAIKLAN